MCKAVDMLQSAGPESELQQASCKLITVVVRHCQHYTLRDKELELLLSLAANDIEDIHNHSATFALLKVIYTLCADLFQNLLNTHTHEIQSILGRKHTSQSLLKLIDRIAVQMVQSQSAPGRQQCGDLLVRFLQSYPLGPKKLQRRLDFLLTNLSYPHPTRRLSVLTVLLSVFSGLPTDVLAVHAVGLLLCCLFLALKQ
jgi:hypothetical protein